MFGVWHIDECRCSRRRDCHAAFRTVRKGEGRASDATYRQRVPRLQHRVDGIPRVSSPTQSRTVDQRRSDGDLGRTRSGVDPLGAEDIRRITAGCPWFRRVLPAQVRDLLANRSPRWVRLHVARWADPSEVMLRHVARTVMCSDGRGGASGAARFGSLTFVGFGELTLCVDIAPEYAPDLQQSAAPPKPWTTVVPRAHFD